MLIKDLRDEDFLNYKKPSMYIATAFCNWKCCTEKGYDISICQNSEIAKQPTLVYSNDDIVSRYVKNIITNAIVFSGLEPFMQREELYSLISDIRNATYDDIVIYTGYTKEELEKEGIIKDFKRFTNIIIKFGRFVMGDKPHYDKILGVNLASDNQYAEKIS